MLSYPQPAITVAEVRLLEWLRLHELHSIERAQLVSMRVLLSAPERAVPVLAVRRVTTGKFVTLERFHLQQRRIVEDNRGVSLTPIVAEA